LPHETGTVSYHLPLVMAVTHIQLRPGSAAQPRPPKGYLGPPTTGLPRATTALPEATAGPPTATTAPPGATTAPPGATAGLPGATTGLPAATAGLHRATTGLPGASLAVHCTDGCSPASPRHTPRHRHHNTGTQAQLHVALLPERIAVYIIQQLPQDPATLLTSQHSGTT
jgi:hypothetical protein